MKRKENDKKNTKKIIILSALLILASIFLLVGATYAWFSDSIKNSNNKIVAGNLDIELYHTKDGAREKITEDTKLFDMALWEPGAVVYENFEIVNEGDLALYYKFVFNIVQFNTVNVNDTEKSLKDVLKVALIAGEFNGDREAAKALNYKSNIYSFRLEKPLKEKGENYKFAVVVYWEPSDADNEYNLNNGKTSSDGQPLFIDLGINLEARQFTHEEDSFGNDYDSIEVSSAKELQSYIKTASAGGVIRLNNDINYNAGIAFPANTDVTIDLNEHTLNVTGTIYVDSNRKVQVKNGTLIINGTNLYNSGISMYEKATLTLENIHLITHNIGGISPWGKNANINLINCQVNAEGYAFSTNASNPKNYYPTVNIKNTRIIASSDPNHVHSPILLNVPGQLNIEDSTIEGRANAVIVRGGTAVIKNSTLTNNATTTEGENYDTSWDQGSGVPKAVITMGNNNPTSTFYKYPTNVTLENTTLTSIDNVYPGVYAYGNTEEGMGVTFTYDETSNVGKVVVGNDKVVINGVNAPIGEQ